MQTHSNRIQSWENYERPTFGIRTKTNSHTRDSLRLELIQFQFVEYY